MKSLTLIPGQLSLSQLRDIYSHPVNITLDSGAFAAIDESVACVNAILAEGRTAYGINTGFGLLAQTRISTEDLENLQRSLVLSHAAGVGEPLDDDLARLIMVLKINSLSRGFSGIRLSVIQALYRHLLTEDSAISQSHHNCSKVQDPYSLRCQPQVMGACLTQIRQAAEVLLAEANAVSDNPLVFAAENDVISGGNFHAEPVAMAADNIALAIAEIGSLSERRIALMMDSHMSQLPPFLVKNGGVNSGFMIAQVTAAALASENKALSHPHSVDSLPTSANQEDHVSMAPAAGRRLWAMAENTRGVLAVEWLAAAQGLDMREGLTTSPLLEEARHLLRERVPHYTQDRYFAPDIDNAIALLAARHLTRLLPAVLH